MNLVHNGIVLYFVDKASPALKNVRNLFQQVRHEAAMTAQAVPRQYDRIRPLRGLSNFLARDLTTAVTDLDSDLSTRFSNFNLNVRRQMNSLNSIIMGGVALSMSGIGIAAVGNQLMRTIGNWVQTAETFEKVLTEIRFLGRTTAEEFSALRSTIIDVGIRLPLSNLEVARGVLDTIKVGFTATEAKAMTEATGIMSFFADGALTTAESAQFFNAIMKQTGKGASDANLILDKLAKTTQLTALNMEELWSSWRSARAGLGLLETDLDTFLTLLGVARTTLTPRFAGMVVNSFSRALLQASAARGERGDLWNLLGIDLNAVRDPIKILEIVSKKSRELWGETAERRTNLVRLFGVEAMPIFQAYDNFAKNSALTMEEIRDSIRASYGFSGKLADELMNTAWGLRKIVEGTTETFRQLMGDLYRPVLIPLFQALQGFFTGLVRIVERYPTLARIFGYGTGLAGILLTVTGVVMLLGGQFLSLYGSITNALLQIGVMGLSSVEALDRMNAGSVTVGMMLQKKLLAPLVLIGKKILLLSAIFGGLALAWRYDMFRIRTSVRSFTNNIVNSWSTAMQVLREYEGAGLGDRARMFLTRENMWVQFTGVIIALGKAWEALNSAFRDQKKYGGFVISEDQYQALKIIGIAEHVGLIIDYFVAISGFWDGFVRSMVDGYRMIYNLILWPLGRIFDVLYRGFVRVAQAFGFLTRLGGPDISAWELLGEKLGTVLSLLISIKVVTLVWSKILSKAFLFGGNMVKLLTKIKGGIPPAPPGAGAGAKQIAWTKSALKTTARYTLGERLTNILGTMFKTMGQKISGSKLLQQGEIDYTPVGERIKRSVSKAIDGKMKGAFGAVHATKGQGWLNKLLYGKKFTLTSFLRRPQTVSVGGILTPKVLNVLSGILKFLKGVPLFQIGLTALNMLFAKPGERLDAGIQTGVGLVGATAGAKLGAKLGTAIAPGVGTVIGGIAGGIAGGVAISGVGRAVSQGVHSAIGQIKRPQNRVTPAIPINQYAKGGIVTANRIIQVGEDGAEAIIPLTPKYRDKGYALWQHVGKMFGGEHTTPTTVSNVSNVTFGERSVVIEVQNMGSSIEIQKGAEQMFQAFKRLVEKENMKNYRPARA